MTDKPRLIEVAFPLKQTSIDSVHEKNVRHGHISTLHIWPARRPLAACRAALIATLLPDPGNKKERNEILERLAGIIVDKTKKKKLPGGKIEETYTQETEGGILHWGRESSSDLDWFREKIKEAYEGRAPKVLDPFAGGGAIPLEAMRLGCEATAIDINPVAWFILKCTLEYPQKLAGQKLRLPDFVLKDRDFMESFFKAHGLKGASLKKQLEQLGLDKDENWIPGLNIEAATLEADLAWHVRAWGWWVLQQARRDLANFYPTYADFEPLKESDQKWEKREMRRVSILEDGNLNLKTLNQEFNEEYLKYSYKPRWVPKPTVAYLWARTVKCKSCRATIPLLKTRWLCKKDKKRVLLIMEPNTEKTGVVFGVEIGVPVVGGNAAQKRAYDKKIGAGTMSKSGAQCPCCPSIMTMEDIRLEGKAGRLGTMMTAAIIDGQKGKEYRLPKAEEIKMAAEAEKELERVFAEIPFGLPKEQTPGAAGPKRKSSSLRIYGLFQWIDIFTHRQLLALGTFVKYTSIARLTMKDASYKSEWIEAVEAYLALATSRLADRASTICHWSLGRETIQNTFSRFALPMSWDFSEVNPTSTSSGTYDGQIEWLAQVIEHCSLAQKSAPLSSVRQMSSIGIKESEYWDLILTDPPYYDAIIYSDLMDFFYVWLRRILYGWLPQFDSVFSEPLTPKWNHEKNDGELIDEPGRHGWDIEKGKAVYEDGMSRVFQACHSSLKPEGRLVVVFAHKHPDAWETLVSAIIRAGFVVDGSWPIETEMRNRSRAIGTASLASSIWLVCKKRPTTTRPGWDNRVFEEMRQNITTQLREFWDAGIRGPDFVWAATGPAMEAYSKYPAVKKANEPGKLLSVNEFLSQVRRLVLDFVVGRVLSEVCGAEDVSGLDDITTYYLLHRHDFRMGDAPVGACILYAVSCGLSDNALADQFDILMRTGGKSKAADEEEDEEDEQELAETSEDADTEIEEGTGSKVKLKPWQQRKRKTMGYEAAGGRPIPLIDQAHRLMHLWKAGDVVKVDEYLDEKGLRRNALFHQLLQAIIELADVGSDERALMESISNHIAAKSGTDQLSFL